MTVSRRVQRTVRQEGQYRRVKAADDLTEHIGLRIAYFSELSCTGTERTAGTRP